MTRKRQRLFTNATLEGVDLMPQDQPQTQAERRLIRQYRRMVEAHGAHNRPFTITFYFDYERVQVFCGSPEGNIDK